VWTLPVVPVVPKIHAQSVEKQWGKSQRIDAAENGRPGHANTTKKHEKLIPCPGFVTKTKQQRVCEETNTD
jgi:hypothetical protein